MLRRSGKGASEEDCSEHALSQGMSPSRAQGLDLLLSRDHDNDYTCNLLWIWTRIYKQSLCQLLKLTFTFEKTGCVTTVHGEELFVPIVLISSHPFPCHAHLVGRSSHLAHVCMYIAISCKVGFWSLFVLPPLPWGWSCSSHTPPSCDESLPAPPTRFGPPAQNFF